MAAEDLTFAEFRGVVEWIYDQHPESWEEFKLLYRIPHIPLDDDFANFKRDLKTGQGTAARWLANWRLKI